MAKLGLAKKLDAAAAPIGRYQMVALNDAGFPGMAYLVDTATGFIRLVGLKNPAGLGTWMENATHKPL